MTEFEAERPIPADPQTVFATVADLELLPQWLPGPIAVTATDDGRLHAEVGRRGVDAIGLVRARPAQLRLEWGSEDTPDYAGWLQVMHADPGRCSVTLHLSFLGHQPETHGDGAADEVRRWLDDGLTRLERLVIGGPAS